MNQSIETSERIDQVLSDFFKSQMPREWPPAPVPAGSLAEPSVVVASRSPQHRSDPSRRARLTLAVSVAFLLGALWFMSADMTPGTHPLARPTPGGSIDLSKGSAELPKEFSKPNKGASEKKDGNGFKSGPINLP